MFVCTVHSASTDSTRDGAWKTGSDNKLYMKGSKLIKRVSASKTAKYKVVFVRHGESEFNKLNRFTGWQDVKLTELGIN